MKSIEIKRNQLKSKEINWNQIFFFQIYLKKLIEIIIFHFIFSINFDWIQSILIYSKSIEINRNHSKLIKIIIFHFIFSINFDLIQSILIYSKSFEINRNHPKLIEINFFKSILLKLYLKTLKFIYFWRLKINRNRIFNFDWFRMISIDL